MALDKTVALWGHSQPELTKKVEWPGWETVKLIGRGSFGAVYEIQRDVLGNVEKAALKVISIPQNESDLEEMYCEGHDSESITQTFRNHLQSIVGEYSLMRKMGDCHNIVRSEDIRYIQHEDGIGWDIYIKMELLTPLMKALPDKVSERMVRKVAADICNALVVCKEYEVIHRDIKPQNIFVSAKGEYKLGDFGIAKTVEKTMGGTLIGTYKYMAPEVFYYKPYGHSADIYSLGLVLYWLLNERRMPFLPLPPVKINAGMEEQMRMRRFQGEQLPPPAHGSESLKRIVLKACAYDPKDRYATAADMLRDLQEGFEQKASTAAEKTAAPKKCEVCGAQLLPGRTFCVKCSGLKTVETVLPNKPDVQKVQPKSDQVTPAIKRSQKFETDQKGMVAPKKCEVCGAQLLPGRTFCVKCSGVKIIETVPVVKTAEQQKAEKARRKAEADRLAWEHISRQAKERERLLKEQEEQEKTVVLQDDRTVVLPKEEPVRPAAPKKSENVPAPEKREKAAETVKTDEPKAPVKQKTKRNRLLAVAVIFAIVLAGWFFARPYNGWRTEGGKTYYYVNDSKQVGLHEIDGKTYYFGFNGAMLGYFEVIDGKTYYFGVDGVKCTGWQPINGKVYYFADNGVMQTGWQEIDGKTYYFGADGAKRTGIRYIDGKRYEFDENGVLVKQLEN